MSELLKIELKSRNARWRLLATVSIMALLAVEYSTVEASTAYNDERPSVWIDLGGQLEQQSASSDAFAPPFIFIVPTPGPYKPVSPLEAQKFPRFSYGGEGKISFEPAALDWIFSAAVRYGRSNGNKHVHQQSHVSHQPKYFNGQSFSAQPALANFSDVKTRQNESHLILDFQVGKDVGLGIGGRDRSSVLSLGVRFAQFTSKTSAQIYARPDLQYYNAFGPSPRPVYAPVPKFHVYTAFGDSTRSMHAIGPSVSWEASVPVMGDDSTAFTADWGINGAVLFGRQKANVHHQSTARYFRNQLYNNPVGSFGSSFTHYNFRYHHNGESNRSRAVTIPNVGAFGGLSLRFPNARVSLGYRADFFFGASDVGVDATRRTTTSFHGPYARISIGLGK